MKVYEMDKKMKYLLNLESNVSRHDEMIKRFHNVWSQTVTFEILISRFDTLEKNVMSTLLAKANDIEKQVKQLLEDKVNYSEMKEELIKRALNRDVV